MNNDSSSITLEEVDPQSEWITKATDPIFNDGDIDWIDQVDREAEAVAIAKEEQRSRELQLILVTPHKQRLWLISHLGPTLDALLRGII